MSEENTTAEVPDLPAPEDSVDSKPGIVGWLRSQMRLIAILVGVVTLGAIVVLVAITLYKRPTTPPSAGAATAPHAVGKVPARATKAVPSDATHAATAAASAPVPAMPPQVSSAALDAERKQLEQEREKLEAERKALDEAKQRFASEQHGSRPTPDTARHDAPKAGAVGVGDCQLSGDVASLREGLRRCLGLPEKPASDAKADAVGNKPASPGQH